MVLTLLVLLRGRPGRLPTRAEWPLVLLGGATWFGLYNLALNEAGGRIDAATSALVVQIGPIIVGLLATVLLGERLTGWLLVGMAVGFGGVVLIAYASSGETGGDLVGVLLAVVAAFSFAIGVLTQKRLLTGLRALQLTFWYAVVGWAVCLPWLVPTVRELSSASADTLGWIVYLGIFPSAIAFVCLGVRPLARRRRPLQPVDLPGAVPHGADGVAPARRGAGGAHLRGWRALHRRRAGRAAYAPRSGPARARRARRASELSLSRPWAPRQPPANRGRPRGWRSAGRWPCATPTPCGSTWRSPARGSG